MALDLKKIRVFLGEQWKQLEKRGKNFIESEKVLSVLLDHELNHIQGRVSASKRALIYNVWVDVTGDPGDWKSSCGCVRAQAKCAHRAALLMLAYQKVSSTSMPCQWSQKKNFSKDDAVSTVSEISSKVICRPNYSPVQKEVFDKLREELKSCPEGSGSGVLFLLEEEPQSSTSEDGRSRFRVPDTEQILTSNFVLRSTDQQAVIRERLKLSWSEIVMTAELSSGQAMNPEWARIRRCRLTASRFGDILRAMEKKTPPKSLLESLVVHKNLDRVKAIWWGRTHEKIALKAYCKETEKSVKSTGIWLHESGILGASPDGLVDEDTIIEVKCPYSYRNQLLEEALSGKNSKKYVVFRRDEQWLVNTNHNYFHQIQGELHLTKREKAVLFIWTTRNYQCFPIMRDPEWESNITLLLEFYFQVFVPFIHSR